LQANAKWHPIDAIVLPGGFFWLSRTLGAASFERRIELISQERFADPITATLRALQQLSPGLRLIVGIRAKPSDRRERTEQASVAFDLNGVIGVARKIFPTYGETRGRRFMSPVLDDFRSEERFVALPNGSLALLNSCYDLFGTADLATGRLARRAIIRALRTKRRRLSENDDVFRASRDESLRAFSELVAAKAPDVLLATIHAFQRAGLDGYWQRHGIARASAGFRGALTVGAAHFLEGLPQADGSTLSASKVPKRELDAGVSRRAHALAPLFSAPLITSGASGLLRIFQAKLKTRSAK
jgi:predicted amidohydrolase